MLCSTFPSVLLVLLALPTVPLEKGQNPIQIRLISTVEFEESVWLKPLHLTSW